MRYPRLVNVDGFAAHYDESFDIGPDDGNRAYFGRDVLRGLIEGIDDFVDGRQPRWQRRSRTLGPGLLGSAMWIDDPELLTRLERLSHVCIVVRKRRRNNRRLPSLRAAAQRIPGIATEAFPTLYTMMPKVGGQPMIVGPSHSFGATVPAIRSIGVREGREHVPIVHAKLALLGHFWWHDEGPLGHVEDVVGFSPQRLWISSANFTTGSRMNLEVGYWTEQADLIEGVERFLLRLIADSEPIDSVADDADPELADVDFDDMAMAEALAEMGELDEDDD